MCYLFNFICNIILFPLPPLTTTTIATIQLNLNLIKAKVSITTEPFGSKNTFIGKENDQNMIH